MVIESSSSRQKKLQWVGLTAGLAGVVVIALFAIAVGEAPFGSLANFLYAVPTALIFSLPFLVMVGIAWKWPLAGGILLIIAGLFWPIWRLTTLHVNVSPISLASWLYLISIGILPVSLPMLVSGILFLLSRRFLDDKKSVDSG